ncbi:MAG TPA: sialidase family protein, partial [Anaerolineales bacterium]|nr:sialidase family protein [Anaerolineales bacterium]
MNTRTWIIFAIPTTIFLLLAALLSAIPTQAETPTPPADTVSINGLAYWGVDVTGQGDFDAVYKIPFQAANPTTAVWEATQRQNARFLVPTLDNIQVSASGVVSGASHLINDFSEVMLSIDPTDPNHLLGGSKFFYIPASYLFYTGVFESFDGGLTWTQGQPNGVEDYGLTSDPVTTFDDEGNGYFTLLTRDSGGYTGLDMLKKPVGGTWQAPVTVNDTTYTDKQWIMGDQNPQGTSAYAGNLYMSWTSFGGPVTGIVFSRSTDGNQTWSAPIALASGDVQGSMPGVAPDGSVYVLYGRGIFSTGSGTLEIRKSTNGGQTFGSTIIAANISPIPYYLPNNLNFFPNFRTPASLPSFAVSPVDGNLYLAWADYRNGDADIYFTHSTDGGATWQTPHIRLNDDPLGNGMDQFQPQISIAPNGRVAVMWFDRRLDCPDLPWIPANHVGVSNACIDTFMTRSFDEGQTWVPNIRASAQTWDWTLNLPITSGADGFIGDYQGIASNNDYDFPF